MGDEGDGGSRAHGRLRRAAGAAGRRLGLRPEPASAVRGRARALVADGDLATADDLLTRLLSRDPDDATTLRLAVDVRRRRGELTRASHAADRLEQVDPRAQTRHQAARLRGQLVETDERWRPTIPTSLRAPVEPVAGRVLYLAKESRPYRSNGFCTRTHETLRALRARGVDVICVTMPGFPGDDDSPADTVVDGVVYRHLLPRAGSLADVPADRYLDVAAGMLAREVRDLRPAVLHAASGHRGYETALVAAEVADAAGVPWLYEVRSFFESSWSRDPAVAERSEHHDRRLATEGRVLHRADAVVTLSRTMTEELARAHGLDADALALVPNGVDPARVTAVPRDGSERLGLHGTVLGQVGSVEHPREGHELLVDAVAAARSRGRDVSLLLVGGGARVDELRDRARAAGVDGSVVLTGPVPPQDVPGLLALMDVFVVPRVPERAARLVTPLKPLEAMAAGVPVLMSDLPALVELAGGGERAALFPAGDAEALATAALALADDPERRQRLVDAARRWVVEHRTWDATASVLEAAYADLQRGPR